MKVEAVDLDTGSSAFQITVGVRDRCLQQEMDLVKHESHSYSLLDLYCAWSTLFLVFCMSLPTSYKAPGIFYSVPCASYLVRAHPTRLSTTRPL